MASVCKHWCRRLQQIQHQGPAPLHIFTDVVAFTCNKQIPRSSCFALVCKHWCLHLQQVRFYLDFVKVTFLFVLVFLIIIINSKKFQKKKKNFHTWPNCSSNILNCNKPSIRSSLSAQLHGGCCLHLQHANAQVQLLCTASW